MNVAVFGQLVRQFSMTMQYLAFLVGWSCLNDQATLLEYNTLKGVCQVVYQLLPSDWPICLVLNSGLTGQGTQVPEKRKKGCE